MLLARYGAGRHPPTWRPLAAEISALESLLRRKDDVEQLIRQERNRQHALVGRPNVADTVSRTLDRIIAALGETLQEIEGRSPRICGRTRPCARTALTVKLAAGTAFALPAPLYKGVIAGIWDAANGTAQVTEY